MRQSAFLRQFFLPPTSVKIGRFLCNIDCPHQDYHDPALQSAPPVIEKVQTQYSGSEALSSTNTFASDLNALLSTWISTRTAAAIHTSTNQVKTYYLDNNEQWFRDAVQQEEVRKWMERVIDEGESIYLVVGYHTVLDARIGVQKSEGKEIGGQLTAPISAGLNASGVVVPLGGLVDPSVGGSRDHSESLEMQFEAPGEQIVAVQYRKVKFGFLSSRNVDTAALNKVARWKRYDRPRYLQSEADDMVEVELEDLLDLDGEFEEHRIGSETILFAA
ncbi:hypothetical protein COH20_005579 [Aspergillus flavus]|nr:hypothetical protein COH20_005579 [Aspergillus flavus]RAQ69221.1 hypothetical protein COH21_012315 [Aspergillus flavus]GMF67740.1 unnamed protein product [Aspergillus oryzae]GMF88245.1 unnamed protein product [Aspergillus oryzae]